jgi:Na+/proline symporter
MSAIAIAGVVFVCVFSSALFGLFLRGMLPEHHLSSESKDVVKLAMGLIATMAALVLGLITASAKSSFDAQNSEMVHSAADIIRLDRALARYGSETKEIRDLLKRAVASGSI